MEDEWSPLVHVPVDDPRMQNPRLSFAHGVCRCQPLGVRPKTSPRFLTSHQVGRNSCTSPRPWAKEIPFTTSPCKRARSAAIPAFDTFKNTLNADRSYMRDDYQLEGWMVVNFVALMFYYSVYT